MKKGLFFGSFNPIHNGHLEIARHFLAHSDIEQVLFIVSPQNPLKSPLELCPEQHRLEMVKMAIRNETKIMVSDIEFDMTKPSYTIDTMKILQESYPRDNFAILMGNDSLNDLPKWKNYQELMDKFEIYVYPRSNTTYLAPVHPNVRIFSFPVINISSTTIRNLIKSNLPVSEYIPDSVSAYIQKHQLYRS